jgi:glycerate 2-kinase
MKVLIVPDSFKSTLSSIKVSEIISDVFKSDGFETRSIPIGDGGEGTIDAILYSLGGQKKYTDVLDPLGRKIRTYYGLKDNTAFIEISKASGLMLLEESEYNPSQTTTIGFGQLIKDAANNGVKKIYLGLGGTATNDAGIGMLSALGIKFFDKKRIELQGYLCGSMLEKISSTDNRKINENLKNIEFIVISDVQNPLIGISGATKIFAAQKGASPLMVDKLEKGMVHFASVLKREYDIDTNFPGAGAAGGVGAGLKVFLNANINPGIECVISLLGLEKDIAESDLVIVGEGSIDYQTAFGKAPVGIAQIAKKYNKKVIAISGKLGKNAESLYSKGIDLIFSYYGDVDVNLDYIKKHSEKMLMETAVLAKDKIKTNPNLNNKKFICYETENLYNP